MPHGNREKKGNPFVIKKKTAAFTALLTSALITLVTATPAAADTAPAQTPMQQRVSAALAAEPGGEQTAWNEISWDNGAVVLTLASDTAIASVAAQVGTCTSGNFCAYSSANYGGNKLTFSTCTSGLSVAGLGGPVRSIANSRSSGTVRAYNGGTVVLTVAPGTGKNTLATITSLSCA